VAGIGLHLGVEHLPGRASAQGAVRALVVVVGDEAVDLALEGCHGPGRPLGGEVVLEGLVEALHLPAGLRMVGSRVLQGHAQALELVLEEHTAMAVRARVDGAVSPRTDAGIPKMALAWWKTRTTSEVFVTSTTTEATQSRHEPGITAIMETRNRSRTGWHTDPYGLHQDRWLYDGNPTRLIRDGRNEDYDEPPRARRFLSPSPFTAVNREPRERTLSAPMMPSGKRPWRANRRRALPPTLCQPWGNRLTARPRADC